MIETIMIIIYRLILCVIGGYGVKIACECLEDRRYYPFGLCLFVCLINVGYIFESFTW